MLHSTVTCDHEQKKSIYSMTELNTCTMDNNVSTGGRAMDDNVSTGGRTLDDNVSTNTELKDLLLSMKKDMHDMKQEIMVKLSENQKDIQEIKGELRTLKSTVVEVEKATSFHAEKIQEMEQETLPKLKSEVENKIQNLEEKLLLMEIHDRKNNLLIYGLKETEGEDTQQETLDALHHNYAQKDEHLDRGIVLVACHRLPRSRFARPNADGKLPPRPVIARFAYTSDRLFFGNPRNMRRDCKLRVLDDLPPAMKQERGRLASIAYQLRKERKFKTKIVVKGTKVLLQYRCETEVDWSTYREGAKAN